MIRLFIVALVYTLLLACTSTPSKQPSPDIVTQEVHIPVLVPCISAHKVPERPAEVDYSAGVMEKADLYDSVGIVLHELEGTRRYADELEIVVNGCLEVD